MAATSGCLRIAIERDAARRLDFEELRLHAAGLVAEHLQEHENENSGDGRDQDTDDHHRRDHAEHVEAAVNPSNDEGDENDGEDAGRHHYQDNSNAAS